MVFGVVLPVDPPELTSPKPREKESEKSIIRDSHEESRGAAGGTTQIGLAMTTETPAENQPSVGSTSVRHLLTGSGNSR